jgi:hypothetical protein
MTAHPHISESVTPGRLRDAFLEGVGVSFLIDFRWTPLAKNFAKIDEM